MSAEAIAREVDRNAIAADDNVAPQPVAAEAIAPQGSPLPAQQEKVPDTPQHYLAGFVVLALLFIGAIAVGNRLLAPWNHMPSYKAEMADVMLDGRNFGVFDLNVDIRGIRRVQFAKMAAAPEVMVLGASHWQEAGADLMPGHQMFNAHVHRDYYDDVVAAVGLLIKNDLLPRRLVIAIRDKTFTSVESRTDNLWLPFIPDYRAGERMLGISPRPWTENFQPQKYWGLFSLPNQIDMALRWIDSVEAPGPTPAVKSAGLDILMADGSIRWSEKHDRTFTRTRSRIMAVEMAREVRETPPELDAHAIAAISRTLEVLSEKGVEVILVHPPFNPLFYGEVEGTPYLRGLREVENLTSQLAAAYGAKVAGSFNPHDLGCTSDMYIDAEHSGPPCLRRVLADVAARFAP